MPNKYQVKEYGEEITTYEDVIERLKDVKLEDYTKMDLAERYIIYRHRTRVTRC